MNLYREMRKRQQETLNEYLSQYAFFAFSDKQFAEGLEKLRVQPDQLARIPGGGFILQDRGQGLTDIFDSAQQEREAALRDPVTGEQFAFDMFYAELADHEYSYTGDPVEALDALGMSYNSVLADQMLKRAFDKATAAALE